MVWQQKNRIARFQDRTIRQKIHHCLRRPPRRGEYNHLRRNHRHDDPWEDPKKSGAPALEDVEARSGDSEADKAGASVAEEVVVDEAVVVDEVLILAWLLPCLRMYEDTSSTSCCPR